MSSHGFGDTLGSLLGQPLRAGYTGSPIPSWVFPLHGTISELEMSVRTGYTTVPALPKSETLTLGPASLGPPGALGALGNAPPGSPWPPWAAISASSWKLISFCPREEAELLTLSAARV